MLPENYRDDITDVPAEPTTKKAAIGIGLCVALVVIAAAIGIYKLSAEPAIAIPTPTMPSPNAFDFYVKAGNAIVDEAKITDAITAHSKLTLKQKEALVAKNRTALKILRDALPYPYLNPPIRSLNGTNPYYKKFRQIARLLVLESQVDMAHGRWHDAVNADLDAIQMGEEIPHGGEVIGDLVGIACQSLGQRQNWLAIDHLDATQARHATRRLETIQTHHVAFADVLKEEKWFYQAAILELYDTSLENTVKNRDFDLFVRVRLKGKRGAIQGITHYMDQCIANTRLPYAAHVPEPTVPNDFVTQTYASEYTRAFLKETNQSQTQNALLTVSMALRAYDLEHGSYPVSLSELVPNYLHSVPKDPFALSGPLRYKRFNTHYVLYSLGPDSVDDKGKPIFDSSQPSINAAGTRNPRYYVEEKSKGDIVASVNI